MTSVGMGRQEVPQPWEGGPWGEDSVSAISPPSCLAPGFHSPAHLSAMCSCFASSDSLLRFSTLLLFLGSFQSFQEGCGPAEEEAKHKE